MTLAPTKIKGKYRSLAWRHLYCVFIYIYSLLVEKGICECQNVLVKYQCVYVCLWAGDLLIFFCRNFPFLYKSIIVYFSYFFNYNYLCTFLHLSNVSLVCFTSKIVGQVARFRYSPYMDKLASLFNVSSAEHRSCTKRIHGQTTCPRHNLNLFFRTMQRLETFDVQISEHAILLSKRRSILQWNCRISRPAFYIYC